MSSVLPPPQAALRLRLTDREELGREKGRGRISFFKFLISSFFSYTYLPTFLDHSTGRSFADDTNLSFSACNLSVLKTEMNKDLNKIFIWLCSNKLKYTEDRFYGDRFATKNCIIGRRHRNIESKDHELSWTKQR